MQVKNNANILIIPDSYKGNLSSNRVAAILAESFRWAFPQANVAAYPMADGGESSSEIVGEMLGATRVEHEVCGPEGTAVTGFYYLEKNPQTSNRRAFIELAAASGFALSKNPQLTATRATTYGTGELIKRAIEAGATEIFLFLGGSATTDGGVGFAKALGWNFFAATGALLPPPDLNAGTTYPGEQLDKLAKLDVGKSPELLRGVKIIGITDVRNPLYGPEGAAYIYGPQKGADPAAVESLDKGLRNLEATYADTFDRQLKDIPGTGAAGGTGFGVLAFLGGTLQDGPSFFLDLIEFDKRLPTLDLIVTGEGKVDAQSMRGKLLRELLNRTHETKVPLISFAGVSDLRLTDLEAHPNFKAFGLGHVECLRDPEQALTLLSRQVAQLLRA